MIDRYPQRIARWREHARYLRVEVARGTRIEEAERISEEVIERIHAGDEGGYCVVHVESRKGGA